MGFRNRAKQIPAIPIVQLVKTRKIKMDMSKVLRMPRKMEVIF
jgi:hypothetical protein